MIKWLRSLDEPKILVVVGVLLGIPLLAPVVAYIFVFGHDVSTDHEKWSQFGGYVSGVYAPVIGLLTLMVLFLQFRLQRSEANYRHTQGALDASRAWVEYYVQLLDEELKRIHGGATVGQFVDSTLHCEREADQLAHLKAAAAQLASVRPLVLQAWASIQEELRSIKGSNHPAAEGFHAGAKQKLIATLGRERCMKLDQAFTVSTGQIPSI